jgi:hypothetical protein
MGIAGERFALRDPKRTAPASEGMWGVGNAGAVWRRKPNCRLRYWSTGRPADMKADGFKTVLVYCVWPPDRDPLPAAGTLQQPRPTLPHGEEAVYVLEGATLLLPDGSERPFPTGAAVINVRDVPHAGFKVGGDKPLKMLTVHIVDKGKPLMVPAK